MSLPVTLAVLDEEFPILEERAKRAGWGCTLDRDRLILDVHMSNHAGHGFHLRGDLDGYRATPPAWTFISATGEAGVIAAFPSSPTPTPGGGAQIFIDYGGRPIICLPCNRLCYGTVHKEWQIAGWTALPPQHLTLSDMVNRIYVDLYASAGPRTR